MNAFKFLLAFLFVIFSLSNVNGYVTFRIDTEDASVIESDCASVVKDPNTGEELGTAQDVVSAAMKQCLADQGVDSGSTDEYEPCQPAGRRQLRVSQDRKLNVCYGACTEDSCFDTVAECLSCVILCSHLWACSGTCNCATMVGSGCSRRLTAEEEANEQFKKVMSRKLGLNTQVEQECERQVKEAAKILNHGANLDNMCIGRWNKIRVRAYDE